MITDASLIIFAMLSYRVEGEGSPLLLCHGFGISFNIWTELVPLLRDQFKLVIVELPGIGASPVPLVGTSYPVAATQMLESLRAFLDIPRWSMLGYSSGSRVVEAYVQAYPDRIHRSIFLCPAYVNRKKATGLRIAIYVDHFFPSLGNWILSGKRLHYLIRLLAFNLASNSRERAWHREISAQPLAILKETLRSMPGNGARGFQVPASVPALFLWGNEDWITKNPRSVTASDLIIHANHSAPQTSASEVAGCILDFMKNKGSHS